MPKTDHVFHAMWWHLGQYGRQDIHLHPCIEHEGCSHELVGIGYDCGGRGTEHVERRLLMNSRWKRRELEGTPL